MKKTSETARGRGETAKNRLPGHVDTLKPGRIPYDRRFNPLGIALIVLTGSMLIFSGCARRIQEYPPRQTPKPERYPEPPPDIQKTKPTTSLPKPSTRIRRTGFTIQVGAFRNLNNAVRLTKKLDEQGLQAYYFTHSSGFYKVRCGDFSDRESALSKARMLIGAGIIEEYYIVPPESYAVEKEPYYGTVYLRGEIVKTAQSYLGIPYRWGGTSPDNGFDCSGLTMAVYQLIGLNLPHSSQLQYRLGTPVDRGNIHHGDLVFFKTGKDSQVSHVGVYIGKNRFIHAPGRNKVIREDSFSSGFFRDCYAGARNYIDNRTH